MELSEEQKQCLIEATEQCIETARQKFPGCLIRSVHVTFDVRGTKAGVYHPMQLLIRYNPEIASNQFDLFLDRTVVHEVAHHVVDQVITRRVRAHGREWKSVMRLLGATDIDRCHRYDMDGVKVKKQRRFSYHCGCRAHELSTTRHNRSQRGVVYHCVSCRSPLVFTGVNEHG